MSNNLDKFIFINNKFSANNFTNYSKISMLKSCLSFDNINGILLYLLDNLSFENIDRYFLEIFNQTIKFNNLNSIEKIKLIFNKFNFRKNDIKKVSLILLKEAITNNSTIIIDYLLSIINIKKNRKDIFTISFNLKKYFNYLININNDMVNCGIEYINNILQITQDEKMFYIIRLDDLKSLKEYMLEKEIIFDNTHIKHMAKYDSEKIFKYLYENNFIKIDIQIVNLIIANTVRLISNKERQLCNSSFNYLSKKILCFLVDYNFIQKEHIYAILLINSYDLSLKILTKFANELSQDEMIIYSDLIISDKKYYKLIKPLIDLKYKIDPDIIMKLYENRFSNKFIDYISKKLNKN